MYTRDPLWQRCAMDQRIRFITLAVRDLDVARAFYLDGLGWRAEVDVPGEVLMIRVLRVLRRPRWLPLGDRGEPRPDRRVGAAVR